jgi:5-oxoprolinase (ATP-hydrolysing) subunit C
VIEVVAVTGLATVQDGGRFGRMHQGVPPGGALVPALLARANHGAHNGTTCAAIELAGSLTIVARSPVRLGTDDGAGLRLEAGRTWTLACGAARVRYVAIRGGIDVPEVLGGRGTLLVARLGGLDGRPLRKGDVLCGADADSVDTQMPPAPGLDAPVRVVPGPDLDSFERDTLDALLSATFRISARSDRIGTRLEGPALRRVGEDSAISAPMVRGAIQVPASGEPIVLGPDHPTMGGYPVLATVRSADLGVLMARPFGAEVRFVL